MSDDLDIPDGCTPLESVVITKGLDENGEVVMWHRATDGLNSWEALGMCIVTADTLRDRLRED